MFHKAPAVAILAKAVPKCAHPHIRNDARDVESQGCPENFHKSWLKTYIPSGALLRATENSKYNFCTLDICKTARECELEGFGNSVKHSTVYWATCSRPGPGILVQDMRSGRITRCVHARTILLVCISKTCHPFLRICLLISCPPGLFKSQLPSPISAAFSLHHHQCLTFSHHIT